MRRNFRDMMEIHLFPQALGILGADQDDDQSEGDGGENGQGEVARGEL